MSQLARKKKIKSDARKGINIYYTLHAENLKQMTEAARQNFCLLEKI